MKAQSAKPIVYNGAPNEFGAGGLAHPKRKPATSFGQNFRPEKQAGSIGTGSGPGSVKFGQNEPDKLAPDDRFAL